MENKPRLLFEVEQNSSQEDPDALDFIAFDSQTDKVLKVRLDKWLWAARCFKTLAIAREAIENGQVFYDGQKTNPGKEISVEATLIIMQGKHRRVLIIKRLLTRRRSIDEANPLYEEINDLKEFAGSIDFAAPAFNSTVEKRPRRNLRYLRRNNLDLEDGEVHSNPRK